jgi:hypothetical protein
MRCDAVCVVGVGVNSNVNGAVRRIIPIHDSTQLLFGWDCAPYGSGVGRAAKIL